MPISFFWHYGILSVDLTCSFCSDFELSLFLQRGGVWGGACPHSIKLLKKVNKIKIALLVITHNIAPARVGLN